MNTTPQFRVLAGFLLTALVFAACESATGPNADVSQASLREVSASCVPANGDRVLIDSANAHKLRTPVSEVAAFVKQMQSAALEAGDPAPISAFQKAASSFGVSTAAFATAPAVTALYCGALLRGKLLDVSNADQDPPSTVVVSALTAPSTGQYSKITQSGTKSAGFVYCGGGICVPLFYTWEGLLVVKYDRSGSTVTLRSIDQSVSMKNAQYSPCSIAMGVSTDVYKNGTAFSTTVRVNKKGTYIVGAGTSVWGGITTLSLSVTSPKLVSTATAAGYKCMGGGQFNWSTSLP